MMCSKPERQELGKHDQNSPASTKQRDGARGGGALGTRAETPAAPGESMVEQISTLQSVEDPMLEQVYPELLHLMGRTHAGAIMD